MPQCPTSGRVDPGDFLQQVLPPRKRCGTGKTVHTTSEAYLLPDRSAPNALRASTIDTANPMDSSSPGLSFRVFTPTTSPPSLSKGPPLLPGFIAASI